MISFEVGGGIPGACETRNFTYLVKGPWSQWWCILYFILLPTAGELNEAAGNIWWTNILIAVIGVLLIAGVLAIVITYYKRRMKRAAAVKQCEEVELYEVEPNNIK